MFFDEKRQFETKLATGSQNDDEHLSATAAHLQPLPPLDSSKEQIEANDSERERAEIDFIKSNQIKRTWRCSSSASRSATNSLTLVCTNDFRRICSMSGLFLGLVASMSFTSARRFLEYWLDTLGNLPLMILPARPFRLLKLSNIFNILGQ